MRAIVSGGMIRGGEKFCAQDILAQKSAAVLSAGGETGPGREMFGWCWGVYLGVEDGEEVEDRIQLLAPHRRRTAAGSGAAKSIPQISPKYGKICPK